MGQRVAIVIGVDSSPQSQNTFLKPLTAPPHVARDLAAQLQSPTSNFTIPPGGLLVEEAATAPAIQDVLLDTTATLGADDLLLVAFCGHGMRLTFDSGLTDVVLATYDYHQPRALRSPERYVTTRWLRDTILKSPHVGQIVLLLDCCYAGTINESADDPKIADLRAELAHLLDISKTDPAPQTRPGRTPITRLAISAALPRRTAGAKERSTLFSAALLKGLQGDAGALRADGTVTVASVREFIRQELGDQQMASQAGIDADVVVLATHASPVAQSAAQVHQTLIAEQASRDRLRIEAAANHVESTRLLQLRRQGFVGRVAERAAIRELIEQIRPTGGYVLVKGLAGEGKSSILASLIDEESVTTTPHHFIALTAGRDYQLSLLRALIAQLILKHELSLSYFPEDSYPAMRDHFAVVLKQIAEKGTEETIYVDGLDQLPAELDGRRDLSFLPPQLPPGVVMVLGTRPDDTLKPLEPLYRCDYELPHLSLPDFQALLGDRTPDLLLSALAVDQLYQALDRNALYLALASDELQRTPTADVATLVQTMTANPGNLFQLTLDRLKQQDRLLWDRVIKPVLAVLVVTQEPLTQPMLRSILKVDHDDLRDALDRLGGLVGQSADSRHFLYHLKFREFLQEPPANTPDRPFLFPLEDMQTWHQQLATWCLPTDEAVVTIWHNTTGVEQERRWYARHHALTHLAESQQWEQLWKIITDGRYGQAKCRFDPSTHLYSLDLDRARTTSVNYGTLAQLWQLSLLRVTLASRVDQWPDNLFLRMVLLGQQAEALGRVELLSDSARKIRLLTQIALLIPASEAGLVWQRARATTDILPDDWRRAQALRNLAIAQAHAGLFVVARTTADAISNPTDRAEALRNLATALAHANQFEDARTTADDISEDWQRDQALGALVQALAHAGQFTDARKTANAITDKDMRIKGLSIITTPYFGPYEAAHTAVKDDRTIADTISDNGQHVQAMQALGTSGHDEEHYTSCADALITANTTTNTEDCSEALYTLATALTAAGLFTHARKTVTAITHTELHASALSIIATALAYAGHVDHASTIFVDAHATAGTITDTENRAMALRALAIALTESGHSDAADTVFADARAAFEDVRTAVHAITHAGQRAQALCTLASDLITVDHTDAANTTFTIARITADAIADAGQRDQALRDLASSQATAGLFAAARSTSNAIAHPGLQAEALCSLATAQATAGLFVAARTTTAFIPDAKNRDKALSALATGLAHAGLFTTARTTAASITNEWLRAEALRTLTTALAHAGQFGEADTTANIITNEWLRAEALHNITIALTHAGQFTDARTSIDAITNNRLRTQALSVLATTLIHAGHREAAHTAFEDAHTTANAITDDGRCAEALSTLAMALIQTRSLQAAIRILIPLYEAGFIQEKTTDAKSMIDAIGEGAAYGTPNLTDKDGHLRLLHALHTHGAKMEAQTILAMAWQLATTRKTLLDRLPWIAPWIAQDPTLLPAILDSFAWVDAQLTAMA